mmetsp:Transcript_25827/g.62710  ORF Transcript_25827/g.62710 Transcript_25827/m.62710 type:complete len:278 (+) Transcript_25827:319-1152(+)
MNIVLDPVREIVVNDVSNPFHIESTSSDIRRHHQRILARAELVQNPIPLSLGFVSVHSQRAKSICSQCPCNIVALPLRFSENENFLLFAGDFLEKLLQSATLVVLLNELNTLLNVLVGGQFEISNNTLNWILLEELGRDALYFLWPGSGKHERLTVWSNLRNNLLELRFEAHIQHAVRFIEHKVSHALEVSGTLLEKVDQSPRCSNYNFDSAFEVSGLSRLGCTAVNTGVLNSGACSKLVGLDLDLAGEFASWCEHQNNWSISALQIRLGIDVHDTR